MLIWSQHFNLDQVLISNLIQSVLSFGGPINAISMLPLVYLSVVASRFPSIVVNKTTKIQFNGIHHVLVLGVAILLLSYARRDDVLSLATDQPVSPFDQTEQNLNEEGKFDAPQTIELLFFVYCHVCFWWKIECSLMDCVFGWFRKLWWFGLATKKSRDSACVRLQSDIFLIARNNFLAGMIRAFHSPFLGWLSSRIFTATWASGSTRGVNKMYWYCSEDLLLTDSSVRVGRDDEENKCQSSNPKEWWHDNHVEEFTATFEFNFVSTNQRRRYLPRGILYQSIHLLFR